MENTTLTKATKDDIPFIVELLANDELGELRENHTIPLPNKYYVAFENINNDPNQELIVAKNESNEIIGTMQLSFIQYLTYQGGVRAQIEAVRVKENQRGNGIGEQLITWGIKKAREKKAHVIQLTTDKKRPEALHFYEKLGFSASHEGMKLHL